MRNILVMLKNNLIRNGFVILLVFAGICIYSFVGSSKDGNILEGQGTQIPVGIIDYDNSYLSNDLLNYLSAKLDMKVTLSDDTDTLTDLLINRDISAIIEVPKGLQEAFANGGSNKLITTTLDDYENIAFLELYLESYMKGIKTLSVNANGNAILFEKMLETEINSGKVTLNTAETIDKKAENQKSAFTLSSGFYLMFTMILSLVIALTVLDDKKFGTYNRMRVSPIKPSSYIFGTTLFGICICFLSASGFVAVSVISKMETGLPLWLTCVITFIYALFSVGLSLVIALICKNRMSIIAFASGGTTVACILGGAWFPIDGSVKILSKLAYLMPPYWFMDIVRGVQNDPSFNYIPGILMLLLFTILTFLVAAVMFTKKAK